MIKSFTLLAVFSLILLSCSTVVSSLLEVNVSAAKKTAKRLVNEDVTLLDLEKNRISDDFKKYLATDAGQKYYENVRLKNGELKSLKFKAISGSSTDTMNYRFIGKFKGQPIETEVRVQTFNDQEIIAVFVDPWKDEMTDNEKN
jgi:hypothetical protein